MAMIFINKICFIERNTIKYEPSDMGSICFKFKVLVGGLEHFSFFSRYWEFHHPNWLSYFSEGYAYTTNHIHRLSIDYRYIIHILTIYWNHQPVVFFVNSRRFCCFKWGVQAEGCSAVGMGSRAGRDDATGFFRVLRTCCSLWDDY